MQGPELGDPLMVCMWVVPKIRYGRVEGFRVQGSSQI